MGEEKKGADCHATVYLMLRLTFSENEFKKKIKRKKDSFSGEKWHPDRGRGEASTLSTDKFARKK